MPRPDEELPLSPEKPVAEDVQREVADHLERRTEELMAQGWTAEAARTEARRAFGSVQEVSDECREITARARRNRRRVERLDGLRQDVRFAFRLLRRSPTFAAAAIATLALGVGANTAIFSLINGLLLRPLPYDHGEQLVDVVELHQKGWAHPSYANFADLRTQTSSFQQMAGYLSEPATILGADQPLRVNTAYVSRDFFSMFRARPERGRLTTPADHRLGAAPVVVVSDRFWRDHLGATSDLASVHLRGEFPYQVVGVMPPGFGFPDDADVWQPLELFEQATSRTSHGTTVTARLRDGVTLQAAQRDLDQTMRRIGQTAGADFDAVGTRATWLRDDLAGPARKPLLLLLGGSALLLLTACTNLASTLLARGTARSRELAVRVAIGAGRGRLVRQILTECLVIALGGCGAGLLLGQALLRGAVQIAPATLGLDRGVHLDLRVLGFTAAIAVGTTLLFGFLPALRLSGNGSSTLGRGATRGGSLRRGSIWSALVAVEVAMAVVLLIGSGLLIHSFARVMHVTLGFDPDRVQTVAADLPIQNYPDIGQAVTFHDRTLEAIRALPGVEAAGVTNVLPTEGTGPDGGMEVEGKPRASPAYPSTGYGTYRLASTGFFKALRMTILRGRDFTESDGPSAQPVVIVNRALAEKEWPGEDPIGKRMRPSGMDRDTAPWATVIGVVDDVPGWTAVGTAPETYYLPYRQVPARARDMTFAVRGRVQPDALNGAIRRAITGVDPAVPLLFRPMEQLVASSVADRRFTTALLGLFAAIALLLAAVGIYGVVAYSVAQRTREIGIRIALGAPPQTVGRMVQLGAMRVVVAGTLIGVLGSWAATRLMQSLLYEVTPTDPVAFGAVVVLLLGTAWAASWVPARRGTRIDPLVAIRAE